MVESFGMSRFRWLCIVSLLLPWGECAMPDDMSNFQNEYVCDSNIRLVRPLSVSDVVAAVKRHSRVQAAGTGNSWNNYYCAPSPSESEDEHSTSASIVMTTIRPLTIDVDETELSMWASAGVEIWDLMLYLGKVVLANGTLTEISPENHPFLFRAFQISVGRLGVVVDVKLRIKKETLVKRASVLGIPRADFLKRLKDAQELYKSTGHLPSWTDDAFISWAPTDFTFGLFTLEEVEKVTPLSAVDEEFSKFAEESQAFIAALEAEKINAAVNLKRSAAGKEIADGVDWNIPMTLEPNLVFKDPRSTVPSVEGFFTVFQLLRGNGTFETHEAEYTLPDPVVQGILPVLSDNYEVAVPVDKMADCVEGASSLLESMTPDNGVRAVSPFRFVGKESGLLSVSHDKPYLYIDITDFVYYNQEPRSSNLPFKKLMAFLLTSPLCSPARLHWAKSGWPDAGCWNGAEVFKETWCDFGCAVLTLDPFDKFIGSRPDLWNWSGANLDTCCTADGYDYSVHGCGCDVVPIRTPEECPEAPFYTDR